MTSRVRHYDKDTPFGAWLRRNADKIPSNGIETGTTANDVDMVISCWKNRRTGTQIRSLTQIEIKTRCGDVAFQQMEAFSTLSAFAGVRNFSDIQFRFYGVCFLMLSGTSPDDSDQMFWKRFPISVRFDGKTKPTPKEMLVDKISQSQLIGLLTAELHPISLRKFRPEVTHHGGKIVFTTETTPLGFTVDRIIHKKW